MKTQKGDLLALFRDDEVQVMMHVCNCQGVMGSGIALQIKNQFPEAYAKYKKYEEDHELTLGSVSVASVGEKLIVNLHAQHLYGKDSSHRFLNYEALYCGLEYMRDALNWAHFDGIIGFPKLMGCDRAGGDWRIVEKMIEVVFEDFNVLIVEYDG